MGRGFNSNTNPLSSRQRLVGYVSARVAWWEGGLLLNAGTQIAKDMHEFI